MNLPTPNSSDNSLDRLWDATRPVEPTAAAWNAVWSLLADRLDPVVSAEPVRSEEVIAIKPRIRMGAGLFFAAQAAAVLAALGLGLVRSRPSADLVPFGDSARAQANVPFEMEAGLVGLLRERADGHGFRLIEVALDDRSNALAGDFDALNGFESMAD